MPKLQQISAVLLVVISLALGWYAWVLGTRAVTPKTAPTAVPQQNVVVAAQPLRAGTPIPREALKTVPMPFRPEGAFERTESVVGRIPAENLVVGEPILAQRMHGAETGISTEIAANERAVAVRVDEVVAVGNRLNPRDLVDVYVTERRSGDEVGETQSKLLLIGVKVLAVGNRSALGREEKPATDQGALAKNAVEAPRTVVLVVPDGEVARLALAAETGKLLLALRGNRGATVAAGGSAKITLRELTGGAAPAPLSAPRAAGTPRPAGLSAAEEIEVVRGLKSASGE